MFKKTTCFPVEEVEDVPSNDYEMLEKRNPGTSNDAASFLYNMQQSRRKALNQEHKQIPNKINLKFQLWANSIA